MPSPQQLPWLDISDRMSQATFTTPNFNPPPARIPFLPNEVLAQILDELVFIPNGQPISIALAASDPITKTLRAFLFNSRTYAKARFYLLTRCLYIDSTTRLSQLSFALWTGITDYGPREEFKVDQRIPCKTYDNVDEVSLPWERPQSITKCLFRNQQIKRQGVKNLKRICVPAAEKGQTRLGVTRNDVMEISFVSDVLEKITSLCMVPFIDQDVCTLMDVNEMGELLCILSPTLERLVISAPNPPPYRSYSHREYHRSEYLGPEGTVVWRYSDWPRDGYNINPDRELNGDKLWGYLRQLHALKLFCNLDFNKPRRIAKAALIMTKQWPRLEIIACRTLLHTWHWEAIPSLKRLINIEDRVNFKFYYGALWARSAAHGGTKSFNLMIVSCLPPVAFHDARRTVAGGGGQSLALSGLAIKLLVLGGRALEEDEMRVRDARCVEYTLKRIMGGDWHFASG